MRYTFEDGLELALYVLEDEAYRHKDDPKKALERARERLRYYLNLVKERKFERLRAELGALDL